jgi:hypothetical protein
MSTHEGVPGETDKLWSTRVLVLVLMVSELRGLCARSVELVRR